jgi:3-phosphoshikimate 1-carboxyvinyltransferase
MAMAFAPACQTFGSVQVLDPTVVTKSYPGFWDDLKKVGFVVESNEQ